MQFIELNEIDGCKILVAKSQIISVEEMEPGCFVTVAWFPKCHVGYSVKESLEEIKGLLKRSE